MAKETDTIKYAAGIAQFRFALIAPVIQGLYPDASAKAYYKRVTENPLTLPDGSTVKYMIIPAPFEPPVRSLRATLPVQIVS